MSEYDAGQISILKGLEAVQKRPGMYVGDVTSVSATHHLLYEIFDNSVDEALAGHASDISVVIHEDGSATVTDDGRGIPVAIHPEVGVSSAEVVLTTLHAGGKFDNDSYAFSGGLHGVGSACTNALSDFLELRINREGKIWEARFEKGATIESVHETGNMKRGQKTGTEIRFLPSKDFLSDTNFVSKTLMKRFREVAYLNPGIKISFRDERGEEVIDEVYDFPGGVTDLVTDASEGQELVVPVITASGQHDGVMVDSALVWRSGDVPEEMTAYANNIPQPDGGQHLIGFRAAIAKSLASYADRNKLIKKSSQVSSEDLREGIFGTIHVKIRNPAFSSQTKEKLISTEARVAAENVVGGILDRWLDENPDEAKLIIHRAVMASEAREAAKKAREMTRTKVKSGRVSVVSLPEKLADCSSKNPEERELFLVEGDSAGGSAKQGRDRERQAILPLRGKILNVEKAKMSQILKNNEVEGIIKTLAAGFGNNMDMSKLRYHKLVIMTDADVDGAHIATLIMTLLFRHMRPLIDEGHVYLAVPPLYRIRRKGEEDLFVVSDEERTRNFVERALSAGALSVNGEVMNEAFMSYLEPLIRVEDKFYEAQRSFGNDMLAEAIIGSVDGNGIHKRTKTALNGIRKAALTALAETDPESTWEISIEDNGGLVIRADRDDDGVEESFIVTEDALNNIGVRSLFASWAEADLNGSEILVNGERVFGPMGLISKMRESGSKNALISRYKGLGEMNPEELWETTMNPETRVLHRIRVEDAEQAEETFRDLMADNVSARRGLIEEMFKA